MGATVNRESLLDKIRALLAKTTENGCTEAEALAALDKARAMIDAYEVTEADLQLTKAEAAVLRSEPPGSRDPHNIKRGMASAVARFCDCKVWRGSNGLVFCGLQSDAQFATWLLDNLTSFVQAELVKHLMGNIGDRGERRLVTASFAMGCTARISARLNALVEQSAKVAASNRRALVVTKAGLIADTMARHGIKLGKSRSSRRQVDRSAFTAGAAAGERASFGRPVSGAAGMLRIGQ
jgi:hypothetical protein